MNTDIDWEAYGRNEPYFGVLTHERFQRENLDDRSREMFFGTGREHVAAVLDTIRRRLDPGFSPRRILDFGCGVGRLVVPFASVGDEVVGVDVSEAMLAEARRNCSAFGVTNATLVRSDDELSAVTGTFDLIHSFIVFQHIPIERGTAIFRKLLEHLGEGGVAALHFTYACATAAPVQPTLGNRLKGALGPLGPPLARLRQRLRTRATEGGLPLMQMNSYPLHEILTAIQGTGAASEYVEFTDHGGYLGVMMYFQRP